MSSAADGSVTRLSLPPNMTSLIQPMDQGVLENELPTSPQMSDEETLAAVVGDSTESESVCSDEKDKGEDNKLVSTKEALQCFKKCLSWMESQNDVDTVQLMQLRRMMDFAMRSTYKSLKQTNMLEDFKRL